MRRGPHFKRFPIMKKIEKTIAVAGFALSLAVFCLLQLVCWPVTLVSLALDAALEKTTDTVDFMAAMVKDTDPGEKAGDEDHETTPKA